MLIPVQTLRKIEDGAVTLAFRRWARPRVLPGTRLRTMIGLVEITAAAAIDPTEITDADAKAAGFGSRDELLAFLARKADGDVYRIGVRYAGPDPRIDLRDQDDLSAAELAAIILALQRFDRASQRGPWVLTILQLIAGQPAVRAPDLAAGLGWETVMFKRHVRKLKELGLTESLKVGYQLSPRGRAVLDELVQSSIRGRNT